MGVITKLNNSNIKIDKINYFCESTLSGCINISDNNIKINKLVSSSLDFYINSVDLIYTDTLISNMGQNLTGRALIIEYDVIISLKYTEKNNYNVLYKTFKSIGNSCHIIVPKYFNNIDVERVIANKLYSIYAFLENQEVILKNDETIEFTVTSLFIFNPINNLL